jgi:hypothetical protein
MSDLVEAEKILAAPIGSGSAPATGMTEFLVFQPGE